MIGCIFAVALLCKILLSLSGYEWVIPKKNLEKFLKVRDEIKMYTGNSTTFAFIGAVVLTACCSLEILIWPRSLYHMVARNIKR